MAERAIWPVMFGALRRIGQSVLENRGNGRPHKGIDLFAPAATPVRAAVAGSVVRVIDGRRSASQSRRDAGLWVDVRDASGRIFRYLHLGSVQPQIKAGAQLAMGDPIGTISTKGQSGVLHSDPHVHFEIRTSDFEQARRDYGEPIDPLTVLPLRIAKNA